MFGKTHSSSSSNVVVNVTLDLSNPAFSGTTTVDSLNANKVITKTQLWFGDVDIDNDNTDETYMQKNIITSGVYNASELCINVGDDGTNDTITIPVAEEPGNTDYVTLGASNGIRHVFSTSENYYYANSIVPKYTNLPTLSTLQIGGSEVLTFTNGLYLTGYNYQSASIPIGYYLVIAHLEVTPDSSTNKYIHFGISTTNNLYYSEWGKYYAFHSTHKDTFNFSHYIANDTARDYYFIFTANTEVEVTSSQCTFIRIA